MKYFALIGVLLLAIACGSKADHGAFVDNGTGGAFSTGGTHAIPHAGSGGTAGDTAGGGAAGEAGAGDSELLGPTVEITAPVPVSDPGQMNVLTEDQVVVNCSVTPSKISGAAVLGSSVKIQMFGADGKQIGSDGSVMSTNSANEYSARFVLAGVVPSGPVSFACSASDKATMPRTGTAMVATFYDGGPTIALINPGDKSAHALGTILFKFSALPTPLAKGDQGAAVEAVTLQVNGVAITKVTPVAGMPGYYKSDIDLNDPKTFSPKPVGTVPVTITATNKRGTTASHNFTFIVDSTGPVITIVSPPTNSVQFVGGQTDLMFTVTDEAGGSGVNPASVQVTINTSAPVSYMEGNYWHMGTDLKTFDYSFNTKDYPGPLGISVSIGAFDKAGNKAEGASAFYYLDTVPPIVDMQPPLLQEEREAGNACNISEIFDPLGDSPKDLATVLPVNIFRALLWDLGNFVDSTNGIAFFSDIDTQVGARLYFQQDTTKPLLRNVQSTPGGLCDEIADTSLPFIPLTPVVPTGSAIYDKTAPVVDACVPGNDTPPKYLCNQNSALTRVIQHETATASTNVPVIYAFQPDNAALCTGGQFDLTTKITQDGWICAAVVAQDKLGNRAVSAPLRLCLDAPDFTGVKYQGQPACASGANPPTCVAAQPDGCIPPPHFSETPIRKP